jgi:hypothetical protein
MLLTLFIVLMSLCVVATIALHGDKRVGAVWEQVAHVPRRAMVLPLSESEILAPKQATARMSLRVWVLFVALPFGATLAAAVTLASLHRRRARAEEALSPGAPLADGPAVVFGVVEGEPGAAPPVVVRIHQRGTEVQNKGAWSHKWRETGRDVEVHGFTIVRADGARVRVEPDERVVIHENLVRFELTAYASRERIAEIVPGAQIHVTGELAGAGAAARAGAYRASGAVPVLRPPRTGPMVIADEPVGDTDRHRMRFHALAAAVLAASFVTTVALAMPYSALILDGTHVLATPTEVGTWKTYYKPKNGAGRWITHYALRAEATLPSGAPVTLEDECGYSVYDCAEYGRCADVPFVVSAHRPDLQQIGDGPTIPAVAIALIVMLGICVGGGYPLAALATRPWYMRRKVNDGGKGRLTEGALSA